MLNRPRLRAPITRLARWALTATGEPRVGPASSQPLLEAASAEAAPQPPGDAAPQAEHSQVEARGFGRELRPGYLAAENAAVTRLLYERLSDKDVVSVEQLLRDTPGAWDHYASAPDEASRRHLLLALGMWLGSESLARKTGLVRVEPPEDVHSMTRGALAAAGGLYEADLVVDALIGAGADMSDMKAGLDFGSSSGRVLRVLYAAYPEASWYGCDPNERAIAWASEVLPGIEFFVNDDAPPLPLKDGSLDLVYAISIWSHFAPDLGLSWFDEMRRIIRPGGHLVVTTHGFTSVAYYAEHEQRTLEQSQEIADALYRQGWWYAAEFGEEGDWGVVNPEWGTSFLSPEWLLAQLCPRWRVLEFAPGRNQDNQDVYVLQRV
jgi:SAM-dependent methyltransferase